MLLPPNSSWELGPYRQHTPFDGWYQYQHITIIVKIEPGLNDVSRDLHNIPIRDIVGYGYPTPKIGCKDINIDVAEFRFVVRELRKCPDLVDFSTKTHEIRYQDPDNTRVWHTIQDSASLRSALPLLRQEMNLR